jgi:hypothetical protein
MLPTPAQVAKADSVQGNVGYGNERRRNSAIGLIFVLGALYGAPAVRSTLGLSALETAALAVVAFAVALLVGRNP